MKVLLLANGASIHTGRWANGLSSADLEVVLVTQHRNTLPLSQQIRICQLPFTGGIGYFLNSVALRRLWQLEKPDLLNAHYASGYGTTARLSGCRPLLLSVWGSDVYEFPEKSRFHRQWLRGNLAAATKLASTSHAMAEQLRRVAPDVGDIAITPFGIDVGHFLPQEKLSDGHDDAIVIGTVKTLSPVYGIDLLIESFARLRDELMLEAPYLANRLRLRIVGNGPQKESLQALADRQGVAAITQFVPGVPHEQVPEELAKLDIYAALSRKESFGVAILEAGACGLPVVVSNVGGLPEVVVNGKTGLVVKSESPDEAANALKKLVLDPGLRRGLGDAARDHVKRHYAWRESVDRMISVYREAQSNSSYR